MFSRKELIIWFAFKEFFSPKSCDNSWDFPRLVILLSLTMSLILFAIGTKNTLLNNFAEVLLGKLPNSGIPVWINSDISAGGTRIDKKALLNLSKSNIKFYPYEEVSSTVLRLPGCFRKDNINEKASSCKLWDGGKFADTFQQKKETPVFSGISVFLDDPLWKFDNFKNDNSNLKLPIHLSLAQFMNFNFDAYIEELKQRLPSRFIKKLPTRKEFFSKDYKGDIWISLGESVGKRQLVAMQVKWINRIPVSGDYAFLLPMYIYKSLAFSEEKKKVDFDNEKSIPLVSYYYPESSYSTYVSKVTIPSKGRNKEKLSNCLLQSTSKNIGEVSPHKTRLVKEKYGNIIYRLQPPMTKTWVEACLEDSHKKGRNDDSKEFCKKNYGMGGGRGCPVYTTISEKKISVNFKRKNDGSYLLTVDDVNGKHEYDYLKIINRFYRGFLYVDNASEISSTIENIDKITTPTGAKVFRFHEMYKDSLNRFNILQAILNILGNSFFIIMSIFSLLLIVINYWIVIDHRKHNYNIYMTKGMSFSDIKLLLSLQALGASFISIHIAFFMIFFLVGPIISFIARAQLEKYNNILISTDINLLPINIISYFWVFLVISITSILLCNLLLSNLLKKDLRSDSFFTAARERKDSVDKLNPGHA